MPFPYLFPFYFENPAQAFIVWVDNVDVTGKTLVGASFSYSIGAIGTMNISFESDVVVALNSVVKVYDINLNVFIFSGTVREIKSRQQTYNVYVFDCVVYDYARLIQDTTGITGSFSGTEKQIITELFSTYCPTIIVGSGVIGGLLPLSSPFILNDNSLSEALDSLGAAGSRIWWVDPRVELNYMIASEFAHALYDLSSSPNFSTTYPYHSFEYTQDNISPNANTNQVRTQTFYSGLEVGRYILVTNAVIGAPFTGATYYITDISARLLNTIDTNIRWDFTLTLTDATTLPYILTGHGTNNNFVSRIVNMPSPTLKRTPATKGYVDTRSRGIGIEVIGGGTDVTVADGHAYITIPLAFSGMNLTRAQASVITAGTTNATTIDIYNLTDSQDMLSTAISIASGATVGTVGTINTGYDDVVTNDVLRVDVTTVSTTAPKGLLVALEFQLP